MRAADPVVYVPAGDHPATETIRVGSGIVGMPDGAGLTEIYFEGGIYDQVNMASLADRVAHAYGRLKKRYPTVARMVVPQDAVIAVGTFDPGEGRIELTGPDSASLVARWLTRGEELLDPTELICRRGPA
jgi:hypothetical protein